MQIPNKHLNTLTGFILRFTNLYTLSTLTLAGATPWLSDLCRGSIGTRSHKFDCQAAHTVKSTFGMSN